MSRLHLDDANPENISESIDSEVNKPKRITKAYKQQYRKAWEKVPEFKEWISEMRGNKEKAFCKICQSSLQACKISLVKHAVSMKHCKLAQKYVANLENQRIVQSPIDNDLPECSRFNEEDIRAAHDSTSIDNESTVSIEFQANHLLKNSSTNKPKLNNQPSLTTHVLDTSKGLPAANLPLTLYKLIDGRWTLQHESMTNADGRCPDLTTNANITPGRYKLHFETELYFSRRNTSTFYPFVEVIFDICSPEHYHVPLILSPYSYSTYRGS